MAYFFGRFVVSLGRVMVLRLCFGVVCASFRHTLQMKVVFLATQFLCTVDVLHWLHVRMLSADGIAYIHLSHIGL